MLPVFLLAPAVPGAGQDTLTQPTGAGAASPSPELFNLCWKRSPGRTLECVDTAPSEPSAPGQCSLWRKSREMMSGQVLLLDTSVDVEDARCWNSLL